MESAGLGVRPRVDGALHDDGGGCLAGVAAGRLGTPVPPAVSLPHATVTQCPLVAATNSVFLSLVE